MGIIHNELKSKMSNNVRIKQRLAPKSRSLHSWIVCCNLVLGVLASFAVSRPFMVQAFDAVALKIAFPFRQALGKDPELSNRLHIFALDDKTTAITQMGDFGFSGWSYIIEVIQRQQPKAIVIDKIFALSTGQSHAEALIQTLRKSSAPVFVGGYLSHYATEGRTPLGAELPKFKGYLRLDGAESRFQGRRFAYGPQAALVPHFQGVGHISLEDNARYQAVSTTSDGVQTIHLSLLIAKTIEWTGSHLDIDGHSVRLDGTGRILTNIVSPAQLRNRSRTMATLLKDNQARQKVLEEIEPSDIVLLLPQMFTGNTDFKETGFGMLEGGYILASALNSTLTGQWLSTLEISLSVYLSISMLLGLMLLFMRLKTVRNIYIAAMTLSVIGFFVSFIFLHSYWPILSLITHASINFLPIYFMLVRRHEQRTQAIIHSLGSSMGAANIEKIVDSPHLVLRPPEEKKLTILFLDMVGFSLMSDSASPDQLFASLKKHLQLIESIVHRHAGIVDKILGDGVMCFFGVDLGEHVTGRKSSVEDESHIEKAIRCAVELQLMAANLCIEDASRKGLVFPYRIGINTDKCYFGDLGGDDRIEFTCIGRGVNFAARLESNADPFKILLGRGSMDALRAIGSVPSAVPKKIQIKHYSEYFESFEINPFEDNPLLLTHAIDAYRRVHNLRQIEPRYKLGYLPGIEVFVADLPAVIRDVSNSGLAVAVKELYGRGALVEVKIRGLTVSGDAAEFRFMGEVKSSMLDAGTPQMGLLIKNLKASESQALCCELRNVTEQRTKSR
jgi:class 3 adenylate cyclase